MSKTATFIFFTLGLFLVLILTNPKEQAHRDAVRSKANTAFQKNLQQTQTDGGLEELGKGLGLLFGGLFIDKLVDNCVTSENYFLFSLTKVTIKEKTRTIGFGILGNIFISSEIDKTLKDFNNQDELEKEDKSSVADDIEKYDSSEQDGGNTSEIQKYEPFDDILSVSGILQVESITQRVPVDVFSDKDTNYTALVLHTDKSFILGVAPYSIETEMDKVIINSDVSEYDYLVNELVTLRARVSFAETSDKNHCAMTETIYSLKSKN